MVKQANEGFRPPVFFTIDKNKIENHNLEVHLPTNKQKHKIKDGIQETQKHLDGLLNNDSEVKESSQKDMGNPTNLLQESGRDKVVGAKKSTNLLIVSQGRSGSSFVGQIFNQSPKVFYMYEPLLTVERVHDIDTFIGNNTEHYSELATKWLDEIFKCNFTKSAYLDYLSRPAHFRLSSRVLKSPPFCSKDAAQLSSNEILAQNKCKKIEADVLSEICRNYTVKVVKVLEHRLPNRTLENLQRQHPEGKILYLVRDPRALILSMYQSGWISRLDGKKIIPYTPTSERFHWYVQRICSQMEENIKFVQSRPQWPLGHMLLLRYEDLIMRTGNATRKLFDLVGLRQPRDLATWLYQQMHSTNSTVGGMEGRYTLERNSTLAMMKWRTEGPLQIIATIEKHCKLVMETMGYIMTNGSLSVQHDLSIPLVKDIQ